MRFSTVIPSVLLVAFLAVLNVIAAEPQVNSNALLTSDNVEADLIYKYFEKRIRPEGTTDAAKNGTEAATSTGNHSDGGESESSANAASSKDNGKGKTATEATEETTTASTKTNKKAKAAGSFDSIPIFSNGDLFYLGVAVTLFLWCTGKAIDVKMERQEKYAESQIHSI